MAGKPKNIVRVPKPPRSAFDKERPASRLLLDQMIHVANALSMYLLTLDNRAAQKPVTEEQAGYFVGLATSILHPHTAPSLAGKKSRTARKKKGKGRG
jgi:hypothetical protein